MKKFSVILLTIIAIVVFSSCKNQNKEEGNPKDYIDDVRAGLFLETSMPPEETDSLIVDSVAEVADTVIE